MHTKADRPCKRAASAIFALVLAVPVMALAAGGLDLNGTYVGGGGGKSQIQEPDGGDKSGGKTSGKAFLGYEFNKTFSLEAGYVDLGKHDIGGGGTVHERGPFIEALLRFAASKSTSPFLKGGLHHLKVTTRPPDAETQEQGYAPAWGAGINFTIAKHVGLRFEWERFKLEQHDSDSVSVNIVHYYRR